MYMRNRVNGVWSAWSPDVFQSGVDAKQGIVNAINAKGGSASMNDDWATLAAKVNAIQTGPKYATGVAITGAANDRSLFMRRKGGTESICYIAVSGLAFRPNRIIYNVGEFIYAYTSKSRDAGINGYNILSFDPDSSLSDFGIRIYERAGTLHLEYRKKATEMEIGTKIYFEKETGNVVQVIGHRSGDVIETTVDQDFETYKALSERVPETIGTIQLEYDAYEADYNAGGYISLIDLETLAPLFTYPDPVDPETPQEPRSALSKQVDRLAAESNANQLALMELHMMLLDEMLDAE
ncbi:hypothetical protein PC120_g25955 [Phytophthora cactorum]|nr:hypothetical protein PC120_g25955 [Phytophthora cactorum]